ncbi:hypothetical protein FBR05_06950 [Deltaproteobacteria bacterium PRO3]|nr:hypothetical protein [Deltaproteobacteria bacterium PRO3]
MPRINPNSAKRHFIKSFSLLALFAALLACAKAPPRTALDAATSAGLQQELDAYARRRAELPGLSAFVQVKLSAGGKNELFDAALLASPPDKLYLQILDDLGQERARVVADGAQVLFFDAQENRYERIPQDGEALKKTLRLPLSVEELIDRLLKRLPPQAEARWEAANDKHNTEIRYWVRRGGDRLGLGAAPLDLASYEAISPSGKWSYRIDYGPNAMQWTFRRPKARLSLSFQDLDTAKAPPDSRFDTEPPPGAAPR